MERRDVLTRLKFLFDQVQQAAERGEHLSERLPLEIQPASLNYDDDLVRIQGEYNRAVAQARAEGVLTVADLQEERLPLRFDRRK